MGKALSTEQQADQEVEYVIGHNSSFVDSAVKKESHRHVASPQQVALFK